MKWLKFSRFTLEHYVPLGKVFVVLRISTTATLDSLCLVTFIRLRNTSDFHSIKETQWYRRIKAICRFVQFVSLSLSTRSSPQSFRPLWYIVPVCMCVCVCLFICSPRKKKNTYDRNCSHHPEAYSTRSHVYWIYYEETVYHSILNSEMSPMSSIVRRIYDCFFVSRRTRPLW